MPVLISRTALETIVASRFQARRGDCLFVFAVPVQTSVGKLGLCLETQLRPAGYLFC